MHERFSQKSLKDPTDLFTTLKLQNPMQGVLEIYEIRRSPDFEALNLLKGWSGNREWLLKSFHIGIR